jgi:xylulokinase
MGLSASEIIASGGGARSRTWLQIQADVFNTPMKVTDTSEQAGLGAAIAAGTGAGIYQSVEEGCERAVHYKDLTVEPDPESHRIYEEYFRIFKETYRSSKDVLEQITLLGRRTS